MHKNRLNGRELTASSSDMPGWVYANEVDRDNYSTRVYERAAATPNKFLEQAQRFSVGEIIRNDKGLKAVNASYLSCPDDAMALQFGGVVTDFKEGNQGLRWGGLILQLLRRKSHDSGT